MLKSRNSSLGSAAVILLKRHPMRVYYQARSTENTKKAFSEELSVDNQDSTVFQLLISKLNLVIV